MHRTLTTLTTLAIALCIVGSAYAEDAKRPKDGTRGRDVDEIVARLDQNKDGELSRAECESAPKLAKRFDEIDGDKNGRLSRQELHAFQSERQGRRGAAK